MLALFFGFHGMIQIRHALFFGVLGAIQWYQMHYCIHSTLACTHQQWGAPWYDVVLSLTKLFEMAELPKSLTNHSTILNILKIEILVCKN